METRGIDRGFFCPDSPIHEAFRWNSNANDLSGSVESLRVTGRMWPGLGDIVSLVKIVSLDFLETRNLTFSSQCSSIGLYCAGSVFDHTGSLACLVSGFAWVCSGLILELLSYSFIGLSLPACWIAPHHHTGALMLP